ncbi:hypothetical protein VUJ46_09515 [Chryseobacterium sp. MYb264]|uniref:hypothetical protein n=1 Tax=Chryseobacterium sp. MYb264 TaxID=2745153 RepID=UPI002E140B94|nr:hypothetical protein VUJ46_09515 [Chryseobacterium sp. MYb264]
MQILRPFLLFISIVLFGWLFVSNAIQINMASTLNEAEIKSEITRINNFTDTEDLKQYAIGKVNYLKSMREKSSHRSLIRATIILLLALLQIILYATRANFSTTKAKNF